MRTAQPYDPLTGRSLARFEQKLAQARAASTDAGCWLWPGKPNGNGYGTFGVYDGGTTRTRLAHKQAFTQAIGEVPEGRIVRHTCDVRLCVNHAHMVLGSTEDNTRDMLSRGRARGQTGARTQPRRRLKQPSRSMRCLSI